MKHLLHITMITCCKLASFSCMNFHFLYTHQFSNLSEQNAQFSIPCISFQLKSTQHNKQAGTGPSRRHSSKIAKLLQSVKVLSSTASEKPKRWIELARQGGHFEIFYLFCRESSKIKGMTLWRITIYRRKRPKKLKG